MPGEYVDPQPVAVDIDGDEAVGVAPDTDVEALVATIQAELDRSRSRIAELTSGMDADTVRRYLAKIDAVFVAFDRFYVLLLRAEQERDEARASLVQLRSAWNAHFARCSTPLVEGMTDEEFFKKIDEWKNAPSGTASA